MKPITAMLLIAGMAFLAAWWLGRSRPEPYVQDPLPVDGTAPTSTDFDPQGCQVQGSLRESRVLGIRPSRVLVATARTRNPEVRSLRLAIVRHTPAGDRFVTVSAPAPGERGIRIEHAIASDDDPSAYEARGLFELETPAGRRWHRVAARFPP